LNGATEVRILVVGDLMLDRYIIGSVDRISPEAPVPVVRVEGESLALGGAGNVAANVVALGARCDVVGSIGDDAEGVLLVRKLEEMGVGTEGVVSLPGRPTTVKTRVMARHQHVTRVDREDASDIPPEGMEALLARIERTLPKVDGVALEDYNKGVLLIPLIRQTIEAGLARGIPLVVDPKRLRFFDYFGATVFKPNARELEDALGDRLQAEDSEWMESVRSRLDVENLLLTLGERGMALQSREEGYLRVPTVARDVYDVSGAGDTVTAVMAAGLAAGATPLEAAILANHAAAVEVARAGVATVTPQEILRQQAALSDEDEK
jgi:D-beta-D-heptose 7-phosphate kinase/D-beta-D-heptose 1-phosphate adenosyltransferase